NWNIYGANTWLSPIYNRMHEHLLMQDILHADESTLQVLSEPDRPATSKSYMWLYRTGRMVLQSSCMITKKLVQLNTQFASWKDSKGTCMWMGTLVIMGFPT